MTKAKTRAPRLQAVVSPMVISLSEVTSMMLDSVWLKQKPYTLCEISSYQRQAMAEYVTTSLGVW